MSSKATAWAWEQPVTGLTRLVLLTLADVANQDGQSWYTRKHLAERATVSLPTLARALDTLEGLGLVEREHRHRDDGSLSSSLYRLNLGSFHEILGSITQTPGSLHEIHHESKRESNSDPTVLKNSATTKGAPDFEKLITDFAGTFNEGEVREHIADALSHINAKKWTDKTRYCRNWLKRAAERVPNGQTRPHPTAPLSQFTRGAGSAPTPAGQDSDWWRRVGRYQAE